MPHSKRLAQLREALLAWFDEHRRELPWRARPGQGPADAYAVWVSEVMLQQTRVEVVRDYYARWMKALPSLVDLASADEQRVLSLWQGLGYYSRARRLRQGAQYVLEHHGGRLPADVEQLRRVPGIGPYSAGAIASIAYDEPAAVVDGNVIRVLSRLLAWPGDPQKAPLKKGLWELAGRLALGERPGELNQALMELGALVCTPQKPACYRCPWSKSCRALAIGEPTRFPELAKKGAPTLVTIVVLLARHRGRWLLHRRPGDARWWAGLWTFPFAEVPAGRETADALGHALASAGLSRQTRTDRLPEVTHTITRFRITLQPHLASLTGQRPPVPEEFDWVPSGQLEQLPLPAPHRKLARAHT